MTGRRRSRMEGPVDGALHLLDRQIVDSEGRLLGKADDIELTERRGRLTVTALLTGPAALLPRLAGAHGDALLERWRALRPSEPDRTTPWRIDLSLVHRLDSAFHLSVERDEVLAKDPVAHRLSRLTGMHVRGPGGRIGRVLDARFEPDGRGDPVLSSLVVGRGRPGSLLGYDRRGDQGPALVRLVVRRLHRHSVLVPASSAEVDWEAGVVRVDHEPSDPPGHPFG